MNYKATTAVLAAATLGLLAAQVRAGAAEDANVERKLEEAARQMTAELVPNADPILNLVRVSAGPGRLLTYHHVLNITPAEAPKFARFEAAVVPELRKNACTNPRTLPFRQAGVTLVYMFRDPEGRELGTLRVAPRDCLG